GFPDSKLIISASSCLCAWVNSNNLRTMEERSPMGLSFHICHALCASAIAFLQSATPRSGTVPIAEFVEGLITSKVELPSTNSSFIYAFCINKLFFMVAQHLNPLYGLC